MEFIATDQAPKAGGHYSQAVVHGGLVYCAGQLPIVPGSAPDSSGTVEDQTRQTLKNLQGVLEAAGSGLDLVLKTTVYVADLESWPTVNQVYAEVFGEHRPARAIVPCGPLHYGFALEIDAIAAVRTKE